MINCVITNTIYKIGLSLCRWCCTKKINADSYSAQNIIIVKIPSGNISENYIKMILTTMLSFSLRKEMKSRIICTEILLDFFCTMPTYGFWISIIENAGSQKFLCLLFNKIRLIFNQSRYFWDDPCRFAFS